MSDAYKNYSGLVYLKADGSNIHKIGVLLEKLWSRVSAYQYYREIEQTDDSKNIAEHSLLVAKEYMRSLKIITGVSDDQPIEDWDLTWAAASRIQEHKNRSQKGGGE